MRGLRTAETRRIGEHRTVDPQGQIEHVRCGDELSVHVGGGDAPITYALSGDPWVFEVWGRATIASDGRLRVLPGPGAEDPVILRVRGTGACTVHLRRSGRPVGELTVVADR